MSGSDQYTHLLNAIGVASLIFQISATALIALLSYAIARSVPRRFMLYWSTGWVSYCLALTAVLLANLFTPLHAPLDFVYFFLEYAATLAIFIACHYVARNKPPAHVAWVLVAAAIVAGADTALATNFYMAFAVHGAIMGLAWAACLVALWPALQKPEVGPGVQVVAIGLGLLALDYMQHLPTALVAMSTRAPVNPYYYMITSLVDGMLDFVLGFGTVVVIVDAVRTELEAANVRLMLAHQRTEEALHRDPMTNTLNRYSFFAAFGQADASSKTSGSVVVADVNDLKRINDNYGHAAGDDAIRGVARALLSLVRSDDPVYRWGGDEFLVVMFGVPEEVARRRMDRLSDAVARETSELTALMGPVTATFGVAGFEAGSSIASAIDRADVSMYAAKPARQRTV